MSLDPKSKYYDAGGIEVMDVIRAKLTPEQFEGYLLGNVIKYSLRANHKGQKQRDIEKIEHYAKELQDITAPKFDTTPSVINLDGQAGQPVLTIPPLEVWNWKALSETSYEDEHRKKLQAAGFHPDYVKYGGL